MTPPAPARPDRTWLIAALVLLLEFLIFDRATARHHASIYPQWSDQIQYLTEAYQGYDELQAHGAWAGLRHAYVNPAAQGTLHDLVAVPLFGLTGPSRRVALDLNMLAFLAWQVALLVAVTRLSGSRALGWMAFGLLPALAGPWSAGPGSAVDFRLDHAAMCLMGVTAVVALLTRGFRSRGWSLALGGAVGLTLLERFLTGAYFAPILVAAAIWIACGTDRLARGLNLALAAVVAALLAGPQFWINRSWIQNYYWVGHITGTESAARAPGLDAWASVQYVFQGLAGLHIGPLLLWTTAAVTILLTLGAIFGRRRDFQWPDRDWLFMATVFFAVPAAILCLHRQKSEYVLGVILPGLILLLLWVWAALMRRCKDERAEPTVFPVISAGVFLVLLAGGGYFLGRQLPSPHRQDFLTANAEINRFADVIHAASLTPGLAEPYIGFDRISDSFDGQVLRVICYERHRVWIPIRVMLPISILEVAETDLHDRLPRCHFYLLTEEMPGFGYWPYDRQMVKLQPTLRAWCEQHLVKVDQYQFLDRRMSLYQRRDIP
jgi:hypothetical protein